MQWVEYLFIFGITCVYFVGLYMKFYVPHVTDNKKL